MKEVDKLKVQKMELEGITDGASTALVPKDRNMKVCETCGALQSTTDTDKRMVMHLEGKLHTGYLKIRKVLNELKSKREEHRRMLEKQGIKRSRSRSTSQGKGNRIQ